MAYYVAKMGCLCTQRAKSSTYYAVIYALCVDVPSLAHVVDLNV